MNFHDYINKTLIYESDDDMTHDKFLKILSDTMYKTIGKHCDSPTTCRVHYEQMFKKMDKSAATKLLDMAEKFSEFHPDSIKFYRDLIAKKKSE